jgi:hypothetical protein
VAVVAERITVVAVELVVFVLLSQILEAEALLSLP